MNGSFSLAALIALCAAGLTTGPIAGQGLTATDSLVPSLMRRHSVPGVALAIVRGDSVLALKGFGVARVRDSAAVDPARTMFRVASVAKLFVATAVLQQLERGAVDLSADVDIYLSWRVPPSWPEPVTLERQLTHTAGFDERLIGYAARSRAEVGALGEHLAANLPNRGWRAGEVIGYSNYGFALAAHVVERTSGMPFDRYARERIFLPLGMTRAFYLGVPDSLLADAGEGHFCDEQRCEPAPDVFSHPYPVGLAYATAADMAQFLVVQVNGGAAAAGHVLAATSVALMQEQHFTQDSTLPGMSFAFFNQRHRGHRVLSHGGNVPGTNNLLLLVPDARLGIYFVANGGRSAFGAELRDSLLAMLLPERTSPATSPVTLSDAYVRTLAGPYQLTRYAHRTIEKFPSLFATGVPVRFENGRLVLPYPSAPVAFEPLDSVHFREVGGERRIAFRRSATGQVTHLFAPVPVFGAELPGALERLAWHDAPFFMNEYLSWLLAGPLLALLVAWPLAVAIVWWVRRRAGRAAASGRWPWIAFGAAVTFNLLWALFGFGFVARSVRMFERVEGLVFGVPSNLRALALVPWLMAGLAVVVVFCALVAWPRRWWDPVRRGLYAAIALTAVLTVAFLVRWNYLPVVF